MKMENPFLLICTPSPTLLSRMELAVFPGIFFFLRPSSSPNIGQYILTSMSQTLEMNKISYRRLVQTWSFISLPPKTMCLHYLFQKVNLKWQWQHFILASTTHSIEITLPKVSSWAPVLINLTKDILYILILLEFFLQHSTYWTTLFAYSISTSIYLSL